MATKTITLRSYDADGAPVATPPTWTHYVTLDADGLVDPQPAAPVFSAVSGAVGAYRVTVELAAGQSLVALAQAAAFPVEVSLTFEDVAGVDAVLSASHGTGSWKSASVQVVTSTDGAVATTPAGLTRTLSVGALVVDAVGPLTAGDSHTLTRTVAAVPSGQTIAKAWLTLKTHASEPDASAFSQLVITPSNVAGTGHVEDTGGGGTGTLRFDLPATRTRDLVPAKVYDVRILTSGGTVATLERGTLSVVLSPTRAIE